MVAALPFASVPADGAVQDIDRDMSATANTALKPVGVPGRVDMSVGGGGVSGSGGAGASGMVTITVDVGPVPTLLIAATVIVIVLLRVIADVGTVYVSCDAVLLTLVALPRPVLYVKAYPVTDAPPSSPGALHTTTMLSLTSFHAADKARGRCGTVFTGVVMGIVMLLATDDELPAELVASTVTMYVDPSVRPVIVCARVLPETVAVCAVPLPIRQLMV